MRSVGRIRRIVVIAEGGRVQRDRADPRELGMELRIPVISGGIIGGDFTHGVASVGNPGGMVVHGGRPADQIDNRIVVRKLIRGRTGRSLHRSLDGHGVGHRTVIPLRVGIRERRGVLAERVVEIHDHGCGSGFFSRNIDLQAVRAVPGAGRVIFADLNAVDGHNIGITGDCRCAAVRHGVVLPVSVGQKRHHLQIALLLRRQADGLRKGLASDKRSLHSRRVGQGIPVPRLGEGGHRNKRAYKYQRQ